MHPAVSFAIIVSKRRERGGAKTNLFQSVSSSLLDDKMISFVQIINLFQTNRTPSFEARWLYRRASERILKETA